MFVSGENARRLGATVADAWGRTQARGKRLLARLTAWMPGRHA